MKIAIVGAGIIGITTAYELACDGHTVTVFERNSAAAAETSFANAGLVAPGYVTPWAAPGMPAKVLGHLLSRHAPVKIGLPLSAADLSWMWRWWRACAPEVYAKNRARMQRLAFYSRQRLHHVCAERKLEYDRSDGYMVLLRSEKDQKLTRPGLQVLKDAGVSFSEIDEAAARLIEPALNPDTQFAGAIHLPGDEVGNCRQFALLLKDEARRMGVRFEFEKTVLSLRPGTAPSLTLKGEEKEQVFDGIVVSAGWWSAAMLRPIGLSLPMAAVHGYSISANILEPLNAPRSAVMDERFKVAISRLGQRVRVAGSAELGGQPGKMRADSLNTLYKVLADWFPGAGQLSRGVQVWKGARPMLPDGPPVIGPSGAPGIWLNLGHGSSGWALSCGSARALADLMAGRKAEVDLEGLGIERLRA